MKKLEIKTAIQILKPAWEVYEAIVNPEHMSHYFIASATGRLESGREILWSFPEFDFEFPVQVEKTDPVSSDEIASALGSLKKRDRQVKYFLLSNVTREGVDKVLSSIQKGRTYCVIGSSGVGKSTLVNTLLQREILKTGEISHSTNKGRHVTEHRELFVLDNGGIIIDTPGKKELGLTDDEGGLSTTFRHINDLAVKCKYPDCLHCW